jgi:hypothetical protein
MPPAQVARMTGPRLSWGDLLGVWDAIEADLHQVFGIDTSDPDLMGARTWRWLRHRILALLADPRTRTTSQLTSKG